MGWVFLASGIGSLVTPSIVGYVADVPSGQLAAKLLVVVLSAAGALTLRRL